MLVFTLSHIALILFSIFLAGAFITTGYVTAKCLFKKVKRDPLHLN